LIVLSEPTQAFGSYAAAAKADPSCHVGEVARLLWTVILVAMVAGAAVVLRPSIRRIGAFAAASVVWLWIDMEGPVLLSRGDHGLHLADVPVAIGLAAILVAGIRLLIRHRSS
jgi:hypothetical protein